MNGNIIAAVATPSGKGGVALIRISGEGAILLIDRVFFPMSKRKLSSYPPRTEVYGYIINNEEKIDDGMACYFKAPASYTGEDTVELSVHGGRLVTECVLSALIENGARLAGPGEFTRRAFINGKLTLTEAEAIATLLDAVSEEQIKLSSLPKRTKLKEALDALLTRLTSILASLFARIDYPDEDLGEYGRVEAVAELKSLSREIDALLSTYRTAHAVSEGLPTGIVGKTNVGKSSLYNLLLGEDAAIVTDIEGTTRDVLERTVKLGSCLLRLQDTAGIRDTDRADEIERIGIERSKKAIEKSELLLAVFDLSRPLDADDLDTLEAIKENQAEKIAILNKSDKPKLLDTDRIEEAFKHIIFTSTLSDCEGARKKITDKVNELFCDGSLVLGEDAVIANKRQFSALENAKKMLVNAINAYESGVPEDAIATDLECALAFIGEIDGRQVSELVVSEIFKNFCVGK